MSATASLIPSTAGTSSVHPIPFRPESRTLASEVAGVLITLIILLAACLMLVAIAKRRGWLDRWTTAKVPSSARGSTLAVNQVLRVSRKTTLYRISDGHERYLVLESSAVTQLTVLTEDEDPQTHV